MTFFKRIIISITRNKGKSITLFLLIFLISTAISSGISVAIAAGNVEANLRRNMPTILTLSYQPADAAFEDFDRRDTFIREVVEPLGQLPYVHIFDYNITQSVNSRYIRLYMTEADLIFFENMGVDFPAAGVGWSNTFGQAIKGTSQSNFIFIEAGELNLADGRTFTEAELQIPDYHERTSVAIISRHLAEFNHIQIGDTMNFSTILMRPHQNHENIPDNWKDQAHITTWNDYTKIDYQLQVIGIWDFDDQPFFENELMDGTQLMFINQVFSPNWFVQMVEQQYHTYSFCQETSIDPTCFWQPESRPVSMVLSYFILKDPAYMVAFSDAFTEKTIANAFENWEIIDLSNRFDGIHHATDTLLEITTNMMWLTIGAGIIITSLLMIFFLQDRRHEIGIYLALGEKKSRILGQILAEIFIISMVAITIALFTGNIISKQMSQTILHHELTFYEENQDWWHHLDRRMETMFGHPELSAYELVDAFDTSLSPLLILSFYIAGVSTVLFSTVIPAIYIANIKPKKILL